MQDLIHGILHPLTSDYRNVGDVVRKHLGVRGTWFLFLAHLPADALQQIPQSPCQVCWKREALGHKVYADFWRFREVLDESISTRTTRHLDHCSHLLPLFCEKCRETHEIVFEIKKSKVEYE